MVFSKTKFFIKFLFLCTIFISICSFGQNVFEDSMINGENYKKAAFRLWMQEGIQTIRGIIVLVPGSNSDGRDMVNDTSWQHLATQHDFAILGCCFKDKQHEYMAIEEYVDVKKGSGQAMIDFLGRMAKDLGHPEIENAPLALWGTSAGGEFNFEFVCWKPERVLAFVVNKGGVYYSSLAPPQAWEVPGIFFIGSEDDVYRNQIVEGIFAINRRFGAKWLLVEEKGVGHAFEASENFAQFYFNEVIPLRKSSDSNKLRQLGSGYLGSHSTFKFVSEKAYKSENEMTSWFPNKNVAKKWLDFLE